MVRTRVGYAGGSRDNPDYHNLGDHTECLRVEYEPEIVTCEDILEEFWDRHDPTRQSPMTQYENLLLYDGDHQKKTIERSIHRSLSQDPGDLRTRIEPLNTFYAAEDYHQNYYLRSNPTLKDIVENSQHDFLNSPLATKLNALAANELTARELFEQLRVYDIDDGIIDRLHPDHDQRDTGKGSANR